MDNQQLIQNTLDVKTQFRQQSKKLIIAFYIVILLVAVSAILGIVSSSQLQSGYLAPVQVIVIISGALMFPFILGAVYSLIRLDNTSAKLNIYSLIAYICQGVMLSVLVVSVIVSMIQTYCGFFIQHSGFYDGSMIASNMQYSSDAPTCSYIDDYSGSKTELVRTYAIAYLASRCGGSTYSSCMDLNSLKVDAWGDAFGTQLAATIIGAVSNFSLIVIIIMIRQRLKRIRVSAQQNLAILHAQQIASQNINRNQPAIQQVIVTHQIAQPPPYPVQNQQPYYPIPQQEQQQQYGYNPQMNQNYPPAPPPPYQQPQQQNYGYPNQNYNQQYQQGQQNPAYI